MARALVAAWHAKLSFCFEVNFNEGFELRTKRCFFFLSLKFKGRRHQHLKIPFYDVTNAGGVLKSTKVALEVQLCKRH